MENDIFEYRYEYADMEFSKNGAPDERIALDRYAIPSYTDYRVGDTVVAIIDKGKGEKVTATVRYVESSKGTINIIDRLGNTHDVEIDLIHKPLETRPVHLWERWAKGASSVENKEEQQAWLNEFRWLFDGFRYSLGGRIQLSLGQEFVTGKKANITAYNCFVIRSPKTLNDPLAQFLDVLKVAYTQADVMRHGGGVGINITPIATVHGSKTTKQDFIFFLPESHPDHEELKDRILLGKFDKVTVVTNEDDYIRLIQKRNAYEILVHDSVQEMFESDAESMVKASYFKKTIAMDFSNLRKRHAIVYGVNGRSSGAVSWMELFVLIAQLLQQDTIDAIEFAEIFSFIVQLIQQGGSRRGALMLVYEVSGQYVRKFIRRKTTEGFLEGANISVGITEEFMAKVKEGKSVAKVRGMQTVEECSLDLYDALQIWNLIVKSAWECAEPGIVWLGRMNKYSNSWYFSPLIACNPCGEQPLPANGVCNLGHYVLPRFYSETPILGFASTFKYAEDLLKYNINWGDLARACHNAVRLQDNVIDYTMYFMKENEELQKRERRVGIGTMGLGTLLIRMGLTYGSDESIEFIDLLYKFIAYYSYQASIQIAKDKGAFPAFKYSQFIKSLFMMELLDEFPDLDLGLQRWGIRNVTILTEAPTGSTATYIDSIPAFQEKWKGTTSGIEPYYAWTIWRASRLGKMEQRAYIVDDYMKEHGLESEDDLPEFFINAMGMTPEQHVKVQAAIQKWTDSSISKTANCPASYTIKQTDELYMMAYDMGLKGMTIYRDGSRKAQVLSIDKDKAKLESQIEAERLEKLKEENKDNIVSFTGEGKFTGQLVDCDKTIDYNDIFGELFKPNPTQPENKHRKRPNRLFGLTEKWKVPYGEKLAKVYATINVDEDGQPFEVFLTSNTTELNPFIETIGRLSTQFLRYGDTKDNLDQLVKHLRKGQTISSLSNKLATLLEHIAYGKVEFPSGKKSEVRKGQLQQCPECGEMAFDKGNCICHACGESHCN